MAPYGAQSARQGTPERACARLQSAAAGVNKPLPQEVRMNLCAARRCQIGDRYRRGFGAVAAIERGRGNASLVHGDWSGCRNGRYQPQSQDARAVGVRESMARHRDHLEQGAKTRMVSVSSGR